MTNINLIKDLEVLLDEKDPKKITKLKKSITANLSSDSKKIMQQVNMHVDERDPQTREALEKIIKDLKNDKRGDNSNR